MLKTFDSIKLVYVCYSSLYNVIIHFAEDKSCLCHRQVYGTPKLSDGKE